MGEPEFLRACAVGERLTELADDKGDTLLMPAAYHGNAETLIEPCAGPDRANDRGQRSLAGVVGKKEPDVVRALRDAGSDRGPAIHPRWSTATTFAKEQF
ncbi:ankyrin repeat domain-containing protein [Nonomuraea cavernae]|uniref:ankyrin repeat domain-containing protein n=1 Tax=Nonomuraea cavernae TaxID=2045107 RepID=UPI0033D6C004